MNSIERQGKMLIYHKKGGGRMSEKVSEAGLCSMSEQLLSRRYEKSILKSESKQCG